jgi:hypothetical protein
MRGAAPNNFDTLSEVTDVVKPLKVYVDWFIS